MPEFTSNNLVVVYRQNDTDSLDYAKKYQAIYGLDDEQLLPIPCSNIEILGDYQSFQAQVENPIKNALQVTPLSNRQVFAFLLMPFVPGGFIYDGYKVSSTSRISNMQNAIGPRSANLLYDRQQFRRYNETNINTNYICTRIDGTFLVIAQWLQNIENAKQRLLATGGFYIDAYSDYSFSGAGRYTIDLEYFRDSFLQRFGLPIYETRRAELVPDPFFSILLEDSFYWGWGISRGSSSFFRRSEHLRSFFYNADFDGASEMRSIITRTWPSLALKAGYVATAASIGAIDASEFLQPKPFMEALYRGATYGEAFLFAQPLLNSSLCCFGDPLMKVTFPNVFTPDTRSTINESYVKMEDFLARSVMSNYRRSRKIDFLRNYVARGSDVKVQLDLLYPINDFYRKFGEDNYRNDFNILTKDFFNYLQSINRKAHEKLFINLNDFFTSTDNKISDIILQTSYDETFVETIDTENKLESGYWEYIETIEHYDGDYRLYTFEIQIARNIEDFDDNNIIVRANSLQSNDGWFLEASDGTFAPLIGFGVGSNYINRKIKYVAKKEQHLDRGEFYLFRLRQQDQQRQFDWRYQQVLIYH